MSFKNLFVIPFLNRLSYTNLIQKKDIEGFEGHISPKNKL